MVIKNVSLEGFGGNGFDSLLIEVQLHLVHVEQLLILLNQGMRDSK